MLLEVIVMGTSENADMIGDFLTDHGALSVTFEDGGEEALFQVGLNEAPLWRETRIHGFFDQETSLNHLLLKLAATLNQILSYQINSVEDINWVRMTQQKFPAQLFAQRLWVIPPWQTVEKTSDNVILQLNPGLGFGTGTHPTTALCLEWLASCDLTQQTVMDYGCGSGILGLAALALGAKKVWAVDHDPQALIATQNNAELNHFQPSVLQIVPPEQLPMLKADRIVANILANPLCDLAPILMDLLQPGGSLVLSGFLREEMDRVVQAYQPAMQVIDSVIRENWVRLHLETCMK